MAGRGVICLYPKNSQIGRLSIEKVLMYYGRKEDEVMASLAKVYAWDALLDLLRNDGTFFVDSGREIRALSSSKPGSVTFTDKSPFGSKIEDELYDLSRM